MACYGPLLCHKGFCKCRCYGPAVARHEKGASEGAFLLATMPVCRSPAINVTVSQCPIGTCPTKRSPRGRLNALDSRILNPLRIPIQSGRDAL
jgi:hypothetical protein